MLNSETRIERKKKEKSHRIETDSRAKFKHWQTDFHVHVLSHDIVRPLDDLVNNRYQPTV